jgi:phosphoribosylaminoimidazole-succinocarboxamide synthase
MSRPSGVNPGDPRAAGSSVKAAGFLRSGKVRDLFEVGDRLLLVASDRLSAFDVVLPTPIPDKGRVLTGLSRFWFSQTGDIIPNHLLGIDPGELPAGFTDEAGRRELRGRMMLCRRAKVLPVEVIVRGYVSGSGWKDYQRSGAICGIKLPEGLRESDRLPEPIFTRRPRPRSGTTKTSASRPWSTSSADRSRSRFATSPWRCIAGERISPRRPASCSPTPSSSWARLAIPAN